MLANREIELNEIITKLTPSDKLTDVMLLSYAETELSELKMAEQILNEYIHDNFPIAKPFEPKCFQGN
jgi:hypothetical protein